MTKVAVGGGTVVTEHGRLDPAWLTLRPSPTSIERHVHEHGAPVAAGARDSVAVSGGEDRGAGCTAQDVRAAGFRELFLPRTTTIGFATVNNPWNGGLTDTSFAAMIAEEHPQIAAVLLAQLDSEVAAQVFDHLPQDVQPQILRRVAKLGPVPPEAIETLKAMLANRAAGGRKSIGLQLGGTREAAKILSGARKITEQRVMPKLAKIDREVAKAIEEAMFVFDNLLELDDKNLSTLIRSVDADILTKSLKGVEEDVRNRFLGCMSSRAADGIRDEMEARGPMKLADVLDAQKAMIAIARGLVKDGTLQMPGKGGDDDYV